MNDTLTAVGAAATKATVGVAAVEGVPNMVPGSPVLQVIIQVAIAISTLWPSIKSLFKKKV